MYSPAAWRVRKQIVDVFHTMSSTVKNERRFVSDRRKSCPKFDGFH